MADLSAAIGFGASILIQGMGVAASALVGKIATDRLQKKEARLRSPPPSDFSPEIVRDYVYWGIDAVAAITTLLGPMVAFILLLPTLGVQVATLLNLVAIVVSFALFVVALIQDDPVKWFNKYRFKGLFSPVSLAGMSLYLVLGLFSWVLAEPIAG